MTVAAGGNPCYEFGVGVLDAPYYPSQGLKVGEELNRRPSTTNTQQRM